MTTTSHWTLHYTILVLVVLFAGPILGKLQPVASFPVTIFGLNASQTVRLVVEAIGLVILCLFSIRASLQMPDTGRGFSFIRRLILPVTGLFALIAMDKTFQAVGLSLIDRIGSQHYAIAYTTALILTALWTTVSWLLNRDSLERFFSNPAPHIEHTASATGDENSGETESAARSGDTDTVPALPKAKGDQPSTLGRYRVLKELGRGAMGVVYLGKDPTIQRLVAIKTMRLNGFDDTNKLQEIRARFFREAESTGRLSHPNIVTIYDAGEEDDLGYIAMEMLQGTTLKAWTRPSTLLPVETLLPILVTVADALDYAHQQGVVHRDIKPANIMLTNNRVVKVMDFGIATLASSSRTKSEMVMGTPTYMSPEQIAGKKVDGRSDIYSLGIVMFELLTGHPPFAADNISALLYAVTHTPPLRLSALRSDLPPAAQTILDCALKKDPVHRYRRAGEFAQELRSCLEKLAA
ncbi:MAG TPA: serine/threonine-protein kinase [Nitrospira sp.]|nr:serine/threonine-protein kinase [Nitrospira sp.]